MKGKKKSPTKKKPKQELAKKKSGIVLTPWGSLKTHPLNKARQLAVQLLVRIAPPQRMPVAELPTADYHTMLTMLTDRVGSTYGVWPD